MSETFYRALLARDARFDGRFFVAVSTTGIYCRPICPARTPKRENITFYRSAAAAQEAGYRPCLRCRPESSPDLAAWRGTSNTVSRALNLIAAGGLDGDDSDVATLAERLGMGERQLRRLFQKHLGASPVAVAQTRRVLFAKQLIHETRMKMVDVALAAGFRSLRRFNDTFQTLYGRPPSELRRARTRALSSRVAKHAPIRLRLSYAPPYDWAAMREFLSLRAIPGIERVEPGRYMRTISLGGTHGTIEVAPLDDRHALEVAIRFPNVQAFPEIVARIRRQFDLSADMSAIEAQLSQDPRLAPLVSARPGLRVPGAWDAFELSVRAVLGQQITVAGARRLATKLVATYGEPLTGDTDAEALGLTHVFPSAKRLAREPLSLTLGMPRRRGATLNALANAAFRDPLFFERTWDPEATLAQLRALPGIGEWTAQYVALRALRDPDAFPASDIGLLRGFAAGGGVRPSPAELLAQSEAWRPWRAYAAQHLWSAHTRTLRSRSHAA